MKTPLKNFSSQADDNQASNTFYWAPSQTNITEQDHTCGQPNITTLFESQNKVDSGLNPLKEINDCENNTSETRISAIVSGLIWLIIGVSVTIFTYSAASCGECYIVAIGPMVYGIIKTLKGLFNS